MTTRAATLRTGTAIPRRKSGPARAGGSSPRRKQSTDSFAALGRWVPTRRLAAIASTNTNTPTASNRPKVAYDPRYPSTPAA